MLSLPGEWSDSCLRRSHRRRRRSSAASMLRAGRMEEFVTEAAAEEEPWYDQRDLEQGEASPVTV